jgi:transposase-like protein
VRSLLLGLGETVLMLAARGLSTPEMQPSRDERKQVPASPDLIITTTSEALAEVSAWQQRP